MFDRIKFFILIFCFSSFQTPINAAQKEHLWHQIIPLIGNTDITKAHTKEESLKVCTAQALLKNGKIYESLDSEILQTLESLRLFSHILPKMKKTTLYLGYFSLAKNICQITDDLETLRARSAFLDFLYNNPEIVQTLDETLQTIKSAEISFLSNFYAFVPKKNNEPNDFLDDTSEFLKNLNNKIYGNRYIGEVCKRMGQAITLAVLYGSAYSIYKINDLYQRKVDENEKFWEPVVGQNMAKQIASDPTIAVPITALSVLSTVFISASMAKGLKTEFDKSYQKNKSLIVIKDLIKAAQEVVKIVQKNPTLEQFIPEYSIIKKFAEYKKHGATLGDKMLHLIGLLDYYPFNSQPNYYISWQGKIEETFLLYEEIHQEFMPLWQAFAEIDAQVCVQKLLQDEPKGFCISQWVDQALPLLDIQGYWHPMISVQKAVKNNISLGVHGAAYNSIITGANAGGKTTAMTAMMICVIMSQSIGIAPANIYTATPFARMHTYLDITTNLANNESLFMAQANRAQHLFESIKSCNPKQKTFTILDEIFTGTRADFAEKASCQFAQMLANMKHSMAIIATHFPKLTELETTKLFVNYQAAAATINEDGSLTYPYLIIPGISTQNIADHILKHKGILQS